MDVVTMRMEKRGVRIIKCDFNRVIVAYNKLPKKFKARITRLYNWSKELATREKILQGNRKQNVMAQLMDVQMGAAEKVGVQFCLCQEELLDGYSYLKDRYYDLRWKIVNAERRIATLRERLDKLEYCCSYKAVRQKLVTLKGKRQTLYEGQYKAEVAAFASVEKYLTVLRDAREKVKLGKWRRETERPNAKCKANYRQMENMREWIKVAGNIRRDAERITERNQQGK